jgi:acetyl-CoA C-acetyltransferase/acetyl-CoA acyltransferase
MTTFNKKIYATAGYNTIYLGTGRKEFHPKKPRPDFEDYLKETGKGTCSELDNPDFDEGVISSFMPARFLKQGNIPGFLPMAVPGLRQKPCTRVEGACGSGGLALGLGIKSILSGLSDSVYVSGFEVQNNVKSIYCADILAGAGYHKGHRKSGHAYFFPGVFSDRAGAYQKKYKKAPTREALAKWYENWILNARKAPKAQEYHNTKEDLLGFGMTPPNGKFFVEHLNLADCSKVSDGASSIALLSEEGLKKCGVKKEDCIEIVSLGQAIGDITKHPADLTKMENTACAAQKSLDFAGIKKDAIGILELHDCFTMTGLLALEAIGFAKPGEAPQFVLDGNTDADGKFPTNLSGGLGGFGHPTGATGIRQMVDLLHQFTGKASNQADIKKPYGLMISMGGNDMTVSSLIVKKAE